MDAAAITLAGLDVLDELGFERLSMRLVASRLGVQVGGLYYYVPDKASLLRSMADELCSRALARMPVSDDWRADAVGMCAALRQTLLEVRDGGRLLAVSPLAASEVALQLMERLLGTLAQGLPTEGVGTAADTLISYLTGYVLQEQVSVADTDKPALRQLLAQFPLVLAYGHGEPADATFTAAIEAIIVGFEQPRA